jgi:hypothetical protein
MDRVLHWFAHRLHLNLCEADMRKVDGHTYYGVVCLTCKRWTRGAHSPLCPCGWDDRNWPLGKERT